MSIPAQGGSYIRRKDGTLERVAFTEAQSQEPVPPMPPVSTTPPAEPAATDAGLKPKLKD